MRELIAMYRGQVFMVDAHATAQQRITGLYTTHNLWNHVLYMLDQIDAMLPRPVTVPSTFEDITHRARTRAVVTTRPVEQNPDTIAKLNRWLGFVQAVLWAQNIYTLDELRDHTRVALNRG